MSVTGLTLAIGSLVVDWAGEGASTAPEVIVAIATASSLARASERILRSNMGSSPLEKLGLFGACLATAFGSLTPIVAFKTLLSAPRIPALLRERPFFLIWLAQIITVGSFHISHLALPIVGTVLLHASPADMGLLIGAQALPFALFSLPTGVWVDRFERTKLIRISFVGLAAAIASVPLAWSLGVLSLGVLMAAGFAIGSINTLFGTAHQVLVTHTVGRGRLVDAYRVISTTESMIRLMAPAVAGLMIEFMGAPRALMVEVMLLAFAWWVFRAITEPQSAASDAVSDAVSDAPTDPNDMRLWPSIRAGLAYVWHDPALRAIAITAAGWQILFHGFQALQVLYATRELLMSPGQIGLAHIFGGAGALLAGVTLKRINARLGPGRVLPLGLGLTGVAWSLFAVQSAQPVWNVLSMGAVMFLFDFGCVCFFVNYISMRQIMTPDELLGRVTATMRFASVSLAPIGAIATGQIAERIGLRWTLGGLGLLGLAVAISLLRNRSIRQASEAALERLNTPVVLAEATETPQA